MSQPKQIPLRLVAKRPMTIAPGKTVEVGEVFNAQSESDARFLCNIKKAAIATDEDAKAWETTKAKREKAARGAAATA